MVSQKDITIIEKGKIPAGKLIGTYTFLRDVGKTLEKDKAIQVMAKDVAEAKKVQNRWRAYFKGTAHSRKEVQSNKTVIIYLWKGD